MAQGNKLSNDPGEVDSNFFCYAATVLSPHRNVLILHRECINLHEGRLRNKMHLHSTLKGCFFVLKDFDQSQELKTIAKKSLQFYMFPRQDFFVIQTEQVLLYGRWLESKDEYIYVLLYEVLLTFAVQANQNQVQTIEKLAPFLHSNMFVAVVDIVLIWTVS